MRLALAAALGAALLFSTGCNLVIDPDSIPPPEEQPPPPPSRGACIDAAGGHKLCGGAISAGAEARVSAASSGHVVARGSVGGGAAPQVSSPQHQISRGAVSP